MKNTSSSILRLDGQQLAVLWSDGDLSREDAARLPKLKRWLENRRGDPLAILLTKGEPSEIPATAAKTLAADILARFKPLKEGLAMLATLTRLIDRGNQAGLFALCPPPAPTIVNRKPSPFHPGRWPRLDVASRLRTLLDKDLLECRRHPETGPVDETMKGRFALGRLLLAAILHGGLIAKPLLRALIVSLREQRSVLQSHGGRVFVELSLAFGHGEGAEFRRWYPDPLSAVVLLALPQPAHAFLAAAGTTDAKTLDRLIEGAVGAVLRRLNPDKAMPRTLAQLLDAVRLDLETRLPLYLVAYAARDFLCHSLKPAALARLCGIRGNPTTVDVVPARTNEETLSVVDEEEATAAELEPRWRQPLRVALRGTTHRHLRRQLDELLDKGGDDFAPGTAAHLLTAFARYLAGAPPGQGYVPSTLRGIVGLVATYLGGLLPSGKIDLDAEEWASLYEEALADADSTAQRRKLVRALKAFEQFRTTLPNASPLPDRSIFAAGSGPVAVDANIITENEFIRIRARFADPIEYARNELPTVAARLAEIAWLILTLSFRCGLRRMEVVLLKIDDVHLEGRAELLVRPNAMRRLKTKSATRKLPLHALLTNDELKRLHDFVEMRRREEAASRCSPFLFAVPEKGMGCVSPDGMLDVLHRIMREVTGDPSLHFHHLRHGFASRMHLWLAASAGGWTDRIERFLPGCRMTEEEAHAFRRRLYGSEAPTRKDVWAICSLLGHSGPDVSLEHYIHHLDVALACEIEREGIAPSRRAVIAASGLSVAQAYRDLAMMDLHGWIGKRLRKRSRKPPTARACKGKTKKAATASALVNLKKIREILYLASGHFLTVEELSAKYQVPVDKIEGYLRAARWIAELRFYEGGRYRHHFQLGDGRRLLCPALPARKNDMEMIERLGHGFRRAWQADRMRVLRLIEYYAQNAHPDFCGMIFHSPEDAQMARDLVAFLEHCGCHADVIRYVCFDVTTQRSTLAARWRKALGLHPSVKIAKRAPPNGRKDWACPWLGIQVVDRDTKGNERATPALGFVLLMAALAVGLDPPASPVRANRGGSSAPVISTYTGAASASVISLGATNGRPRRCL